MSIRFVAVNDDIVAAYRRGEPDANGMPPERAVAHVSGMPCRSCLRLIGSGEAYLTLAHRPFPAPQPYAEVGPIFLHAENCSRGGGNAEIPAFLESPHYILRGYGADHRIVYGSGQVLETGCIPQAASVLFERREITYVHVRSATNNCFHCRIERA